ncbi:diguanylate cyclase [Magnetofaba australis]|uniref:diguanylate cyclase n=1 Tax=Magnetofaba australis IT-1 TaxID=1434232 RepID=A0A1Y2JZA9_9PROT|nr:diguanylate cyclase [Magnetofaba australis]OSM00209.1 putative two-component response regulator, modulated diguanylate cyclase [Magnetofaba australis IT-1]
MRKSRILIVDDELSNVHILQHLLHDAHTLLVARNGEQALELAARNPPDLILLDIVMPGMDGFEVCERLKADTRTQEIPVIFLTANSSVADEERGLSLGAIDYISKPFSPGIVRLRVSNHLQLKHQRDLLNELSNRDGLTGLANRRRFDEFFYDEWRRARRSGAPLSLVLMDVDHFKNYNDNYGHGQGDNCLRKVAQALADKTPRATDLAARYGGEEFVLALAQTDANGALKMAEQCRAAIESLGEAHDYSSAGPVVTVSVGALTCAPQEHPNITVEGMLKQVDDNLYAAKHAGRNRVVASLLAPA